MRTRIVTKINPIMTQKTQNSQTTALPPQNISAEESILGGIMLDQHAMGRIVDLITPESFYVLAHQEIYQAALDLHLQGKPVDLLTLKSHLEDQQLLSKVGGIDKLSQLLDSTVCAVNIDLYAKLVREKQVRREAIALGYDIATLAQTYPPSSGDTTPLLEDLEKQVHQLTQSHYRTGLSLEDHQCEQLLDKIKQIEISTDDPAKKYYKKLLLGKETKLGIRAIENLYCKSLIANNNTPPKSMAQLREEYGDNINEWLLHGFLPKGNVTLLHALGGVGKTRLTYDWAYHLVTGTPWGEEFSVTNDHRKVLIVQTDETPGDCLRTLESRGFGDNHQLLIKTHWSFDHLASLRREIAENHIEFVIIDSMTSASIGSTFTENETEYAKPILELRDLAAELGVSIVLIHHSNSNGQSRGTKAIHNSVSQVLSLKLPSEGSKSDTTNRLLVIEKSRFRRPTTYKLAFCQDDQTGQWTWVCEGEHKEDKDPEKTGLANQILKYIQLHRNIRLQAKEAAELFGRSLRSINSALLSLVNDGLLNRVRSEEKGRPWLYFLSWENLSSIGGKLFGNNGQTTACQTEPISDAPFGFSGNWQEDLNQNFTSEVEKNLKQGAHEIENYDLDPSYRPGPYDRPPKEEKLDCLIASEPETSTVTESSLASLSGNVSGKVSGHQELTSQDQTASEPETSMMTESYQASLSVHVSSNVTGNESQTLCQEVACQIEPLPEAVSSLTGNGQSKNETLSIDWGNLLFEIDQETDRIGWSKEQRNSYLEQTYQVKSIHQLTDEQIVQFLNTLQVKPSTQPVFLPGQTAIFRDMKVVVQYLVNEIVAVVKEFDNPKAKGFEVAIAHLT